MYPDSIIGGTGWDLTTTLPPEVEACRPDYDLYSVQDIYNRIKGGIRRKETTIKKAKTIVDAGIGFLSRGCQRSCPFCIVHKKEGSLHQVATIDEILNPRSIVLILMDNNLLANPNCMDTLREIRERNLVVDISQGIDCRLVNEEIAQELSKIKHLRHLHMAWDLMSFEQQVMQGIHHLKNWISQKKLMCFVLVGYNTTFEEDVYRVRKLAEEKIEPLVMIYNNSRENRMLRHWARYINSRIFKVADFKDYLPWIKEQQFHQNLRMAV